MKPIFLLLLVLAILGTSLFAQNAKSSAVSLPAGIATWSGEDSDKLLNDPVIKLRLESLLGKTNYASFMENFETLTPIAKDGNILFSSGCMIHACTHLESAIAIDLNVNTIHAAIFDEAKTTRYFNERGSKTPRAIKDWAARLKDLKSHENTDDTP